MPNDAIVVVGQFGAPYGVKGWLHVRSFTEPKTNLADYRPWLWRQGDAAWQPLNVTALRPHKDDLVVQIEQVSDRDAAMRYNRGLIGVPADTLPQLAADEVYWRDLVGCRVTNLQGEGLGEVCEMMATGAHDVLVIQPPSGKRILIPFVKQYVQAVDLEGLNITVDWQRDW